MNRQPSKLCKRRLAKEWRMLTKEPVPCVRAAPNENNILEWHFVILELDDDRYRGGFYHGVIVFPADYPYKPPSVRLLTPQGRFQINTKLCLSITDFHPESWNPLWSVSSILAAVVSFFVEDLSTYGSIKTSKATKISLATKSLEHNVKTSPQFRTLFPDMVKQHYKNVAIAKENNNSMPIEQQEELKKQMEVANRAEALLQGRKCKLFGKQIGLLIFFMGLLTSMFFWLIV